MTGTVLMRKGEKMRLIDADALKQKAFGKRRGLIHTSDSDAMPTIEPQHWMPCSERLPEGDYTIKLVNYEVIAWMPPPDPWRGEEDV